MIKLYDDRAVAVEKNTGKILSPDQDQFSCVLINAPAEVAAQVIAFGNDNIPAAALYDPPDRPGDFGRETQPHCTAKFGFFDTAPTDQVRQILDGTAPFEIRIGKCSFFEANDYDVVKFEIDSPGLVELNSKLSAVPNGDEHPKFNPHMTVAYVLKGKGTALVGRTLPGSNQFTANEVVYSGENKTVLSLGSTGFHNCLPDIPVTMMADGASSVTLSARTAAQFICERLAAIDGIAAWLKDQPC
jgi:2'-5' RNA ligase